MTQRHLYRSAAQVLLSLSVALLALTFSSTAAYNQTTDEGESPSQVKTAVKTATPVAEEQAKEKPAPRAADGVINRAVFTKAVPEGVDDLLAIEAQMKTISAKITRATVGVRIGRAQGSGVIVSNEGYVLTAAHVIGRPGRTGTVILADGTELEATTLGLDRTSDAALMKINKKGNWPTAKMADGRKEIRLGDWCAATGHPGGFDSERTPVVRLGRVILARSRSIQTDCILVGGDSGGPLFNMEGEVIGVNSRIGVSTNWNFHVPIAAYRENWDRLAASEEWGSVPGTRKTVLGVLGKDHENGAEVTDLVPNFPAEQAGIRKGDIITRLGSRKVQNFEHLAALVQAKEPGDRVSVELRRGEEKIIVSLTLAADTD